MAWKYDENGNAKRSVRCGYCGEIGHNRSSCPHQREARLKKIEVYKAKMEEVGPDHEDYDWYKRVVEAQQRNLKTLASRAKGAQRRCGFCGEYGHSRRTCTARKEKINHEVDQAIFAREFVRDVIVQHQIGLGSLVTVDVSRITPDDIKRAQGIVIGYDFDNVTGDHLPKEHNHYYEKTPDVLTVRFINPVPGRWGSEHTEVNVGLPHHWMDPEQVGGEPWANYSQCLLKRIDGEIQCDESILSDDQTEPANIIKQATQMVDPR